LLKALVERIDGSYARVLVGDEGVAVSIAVNNLPPRVHEGMVLSLKFSIDQAATASRSKGVAGRYEPD